MGSKNIFVSFISIYNLKYVSLALCNAQNINFWCEPPVLNRFELYSEMEIIGPFSGQQQEKITSSFLAFRPVVIPHDFEKGSGSSYWPVQGYGSGNLLEARSWQKC